MDINADGHADILCGSFSGVPQIILGNEQGYSPPESLRDGDGNTVLIADFWNFESEQWDKAARAKSEGHCTSVEAVDWDQDGDLDLLLGDYYGGRLYLRLNEGTPQEPRFAAENQPVIVDGKPLVIEHGLSAPRVVDWNGDGRFDILCGGSKGGVYLFVNSGTDSQPLFATQEVLINEVDDPTNAFVRKVPAKDGQPTLPGSSYHIEPVDYDGDGDLDLLVGARSSWSRAPRAELTEEEKVRLEKVKVDLQETVQQLSKLSQSAQTKEERAALVESKEYQGVVARYRALNNERLELEPNQDESGDFVWVFLRR